MRQIQNNPTINENITITSYGFGSTAASGTINGSVSITSLVRGQSVILDLTSGSAQGFVDGGEYFVIPVGTYTFQLASTKNDAYEGTADTACSGNAGAGTIYPNYRIDGIVFVGSSGNINMRGLGNESTGTSSFSLHKNIPNATAIPFMIKDISASGTTASDIVIWNQ